MQFTHTCGTTETFNIEKHIISNKSFHNSKNKERERCIALDVAYRIMNGILWNFIVYFIRA